MSDQTHPGGRPAGQQPDSIAQSVADELNKADQKTTQEVEQDFPVKGPVLEINHVVRALTGCMAMIREIPRLGYNKDQKYDYLRYNDVAIKLQDAMIANNLFIRTRQLGKPEMSGDMVFVRIALDVMHISGQCIHDAVITSGSAKWRWAKGGIDDKVVYKCFTSARKAALLALLSIPALDTDVERDDIEELLERRARDAQGVSDERSRDNYGEGAGRERGSVRSAGDPGGRGDQRETYSSREPASAGDNRARANPDEGRQTRVELTDADIVRTMKTGIRDARDLESADAVWLAHAKFVTTCDDATYHHLAGFFADIWKSDPPKTLT